MARLWTASAAMMLSLLAGEAFAGESEGTPSPLLPGVWYQSEPLGSGDRGAKSTPLVMPPAPEIPDVVVPPPHDTPPPLRSVPTLPPELKPAPPAPVPPKPVVIAPEAQLPEVVSPPLAVRTNLLLGKGTDHGGPLFYASGEYLLWWIRDSHYPVLATTGQFHLNPPGTNPPFTGGGGVLGKPDTVVLFGGDNVDNEERSGGRFTVGGFLPDSKLGWEVTGFFLGERSVNFQASSGTNVIARPFLDLSTGQENVQTTALPGLSSGTLSIHTPSELWGIDANLQCLLCSNCWYRLRLLGGFRYLNLDESLDIREDIAFGSNISTFFGNDFAFLNNAQATVLDSFHTRNQFYGGQLGLATQFRLKTWTLDLFGKVALGATQQRVNIDGSQVVDSPLVGQRAFRGGLLALSSNIGSYERSMFSVVPEAGVTVGKQLGSHTRVFAGYNFLFWSNVVRPGDQVDRVLNPALIPNFLTTSAGNTTVQRPAFTFNETNFWTQGITAGMEFNF